MIAIVLNGTSSSGKTSIVRSLQKLSKAPILHASLDTFTDMFDWSSVHDEDRKDCHRTGVSNFHNCLTILASNRYTVVVDHVFERTEWVEDCFNALGGRDIIFVGVHCLLETVEERERKRGDRRTGLAKAQFEVVHKNKVYDLEVDTSHLSPEQCAETILKYLEKKELP
ncbi:MAG: AAA family ATPase [Spirochaetales bacterium]|jgi:chloramphenicol 3-O phosphotransferase|nr:AAA family ATPase [Spirochaetales bacterium]